MSADFEPHPAPGFMPAYRELAASIHEPQPPAARQGIRERLIRCIWFDQDFSDVLRTEAGEKLTVLSPGWWNLESGPDFRHASIKFSGGAAVKGDVETHLYASAWNQHGHHEDPAYDSVILHVVMWNDTGRETTPRRGGLRQAQPALSGSKGGGEIPILALDRYVGNAVDQLTETLQTEEYPHASTGQAGRCQELIRQSTLDPEWIGQFLDHAGDERMLRKATRFAEMSEFADPEGILYVSLMEAAGFKNNKKPMGRLARLVPLATANRLLRDGGSVALQAALYGMAGLLPDQQELPGASPDTETTAYVAQLREVWASLRPALEGSPMEARSWSFSATRPVNYPTRRIAGVARLLEKAAESGGLIPAIEQELRRSPAAPSVRVARSPAAKAVIGLLTSVTDPYWDRRTTFGGRCLASVNRLIGADRATIMFADAIVPIILAVARARQDRDLENRLHRAYATLPPLPDNSVLRFMASRVFGGTDPAAQVVTSARRQQGLLQLFRDYCESADDGCRRCAFAHALEPK